MYLLSIPFCVICLVAFDSHLRQSDMKSVFHRKFKLVGTVVLYDQVGDRRISATFSILRNLTFPVILSKSFICKFIKTIISTETETASFKSAPVSILTLLKVETNKTWKQPDELVINLMVKQNFEQELIGVSHIVSPKQLLEVLVLVVKDAKGNERVVTLKTKNLTIYQVPQGLKCMRICKRFLYHTCQCAKLYHKLSEHQRVAITTSPPTQSFSIGNNTYSSCSP